MKGRGSPAASECTAASHTGQDLKLQLPPTAKNPARLEEQPPTHLVQRRPYRVDRLTSCEAHAFRPLAASQPITPWTAFPRPRSCLAALPGAGPSRPWPRGKTGPACSGSGHPSNLQASRPIATAEDGLTAGLEQFLGGARPAGRWHRYSVSSLFLSHPAEAGLIDGGRRGHEKSLAAWMNKGGDRPSVWERPGLYPCRICWLKQ